MNALPLTLPLGFAEWMPWTQAAMLALLTFVQEDLPTITGALLAAAAVSVGGIIGFVGLMTPHLLRLAVGPDHRRLLPAVLLAGVLFIVGALVEAFTPGTTILIIGRLIVGFAGVVIIVLSNPTETGSGGDFIFGVVAVMIGAFPLVTDAGAASVI